MRFGGIGEGARSRLLDLVQSHGRNLRLALLIDGLDFQGFGVLAGEAASDDVAVVERENHGFESFRDLLVGVDNGLENVASILPGADMGEVWTHDTVADFALVAAQALGFRFPSRKILRPRAASPANERDTKFREVVACRKRGLRIWRDAL